MGWVTIDRSERTTAGRRGRGRRAIEDENCLPPSLPRGKIGRNVRTTLALGGYFSQPPPPAPERRAGGLAAFRPYLRAAHPRLVSAFAGVGRRHRRHLP